MNNNKARPFHVGTKVRVAREDNMYAGTVWGFRRGVVHFDWDAGDIVDPADYYPAEDLVHASDGAPLGDWEPLHEDMFYEDSEMTGHGGQVFVSLAEANLILRGEADNG